MKKLYFGLLLLADCLIVTSCSKESEITSEPTAIIEDNGNGNETGDSSKIQRDSVYNMLPETRNIILSNEQRQLVEKSNAFSYNLYKLASSTDLQKGKSLLMSPLSAMYVLGMLNEGAIGNTEKELSSLFSLPSGSKDIINAYCQTLLTQAPLADPSTTLQIANIVAVSQDIELSQLFKSQMQQFYLAETASLDFSKSNALQYLNNWCKDNTHGMIPSIIESLSPDTRMALLNAVFFKATWTDKFDPKDTRDETFTSEDSLMTISIPMMHRKAVAMYSPGDIFSILCLPYGSGSNWQMMVMLPNEGKNVDDIINSLTITPWETQWSKNRDCYEVDIKMPRFSTVSDIVLNEIIAQMGATLMFSEAANFSMMTEKGESIMVSLLKQKAAIEVSEEGTKASAVTAAMAETALPHTKKIDFYANRPFVYIIREASSGATFFIGTFRG